MYFCSYAEAKVDGTFGTFCIKVVAEKRIIVTSLRNY
jgi:hypothetical protein